MAGAAETFSPNNLQQLYHGDDKKIDTVASLKLESEAQ